MKENILKNHRFTINPKYKGIICIIISAFGFAFMNLFVKLSGDIPAAEKSFFRNFVAIFISYFIMKKNKIPFSTGNGGLKYLILRSAFGTLGIFCNFYAIGKLCISDASMLNKLSPFFAILFSFLMLKEKVKPYQLICIITAFIGALFILKPGFDSMSTIPALIGIIGGACAGFAYTNVRIASLHNVPGPFIVFFFSMFSCLASAPYLIFNFTPLSMTQLLYLLGAGISASIGQFFITSAYSYSPASEISVYDYTQIIFAAILGIIFLGEFPDILSIIGYIIISSAGIIMFMIKRKKIIQEEQNTKKESTYQEESYTQKEPNYQERLNSQK